MRLVNGVLDMKAPPPPKVPVALPATVSQGAPPGIVSFPAAEVVELLSDPEPLQITKLPYKKRKLK